MTDIDISFVTLMAVPFIAAVVGLLGYFVVEFFAGVISAIGGMFS